jgi:uncharacterized protein YbjT (DUF2867 family)
MLGLYEHHEGKEHLTMILITGAGGTIGNALINELKGTQQRLRLAFHTPRKATRAAAAGYDTALIDYAKPYTLSPALDGVDAVFLLHNGIAGQAEGEINLVDAARIAGVKRIVKLSVWGAEAEEFALAALHRSVERAIAASGLEWTLLRPNNFMQNFLTFDAPTIRSEGAIYAPAGDARVSHIDVRDVARVAAAALIQPGHEGKAYTLAGPQAISYAEAAATLSEALGKPVRYVDVPDEAAHAAMIGDGASEIYADYLIELYHYYRAGKGAGSTTSVKDVTGREPVSFAQFARDYAAAFA